MNTLANKIVKSLTAFALMAALVLAQAPVASAAKIANLTELNRAQVSFTFDDGFASTRTLAAPILEARGIDGVLYLTSGVPDGQITLDNNLPGITWNQVRELQNVYGWEIGGHTRTHVEMPTVTATQNAAELTQSNNAFKANGLNVTNFASPFGAYDNATTTEILKYYKSHRAFQDVGANAAPYNRALLVVRDVNQAVTPAQVQTWVDQAITNKQWLILVFHHTSTTANTGYEYTVTTANLTTMANYVQTKVAAGQIQVTSVEKAITIPGANVIQNSGFEAGLANGWNTDNATAVKADNANHGNYGSPTQSVSMTGAASATHLFSGLTNVSFNSSYILDAFYNATGLTAGELGFYVDEYDTNGNWISGQWLGNVANGTVGFFTKLYNATSTLVNSVRIQTYLTGGAAGTAYVDSVNLNNIDGAPSVTPTPSVVTPTATPSGTPSVTPTPAASNVIVNGSFTDGLTPWTTDNATNVTVQAQAIRFNGNAAASHLFQTVTPIDTAATYNFSAVANTGGLTAGELGFYIDEYNAQGTWISGQWLGAVANGVNSTFSRAYKATSTLVNSIRVQTYLTAGATGNATVDNYTLSNPAATGTVTPTATPSGTPSVTPTVAPSGTPTVTPTSTPSATPTVTPTSTVTPTPSTAPSTNLVVNGGFETVTSGFAANWTRDNNSFVVDTTTKGNAGANSLHFTTNAAYAHAFSSMITVTPATTYKWSQYISALAGTGEFGFYIDEYNAAGTWISGQWKGMVTGPTTGVQTFTYVPTSASVSKVRLQYYVTPNSTLNLYVDSVSLSK